MPKATEWDQLLAKLALDDSQALEAVKSDGEEGEQLRKFVLRFFRHYFVPEAAIKAVRRRPHPKQWLQWAAGLAVSLGTRRGELMETTVPDVDLDRRRVTLRVTKNGRTRAVFINGIAMQVFESMNLRERKRKKDRGLLFPDVTPEQVSMRFIRACRSAGIEDFSFHDLRHTYASLLRKDGAALDEIQNLLGHSDLRMTIRYAHLGPDHLEATASRLDGVLTLPSQVDEPDSRPTMREKNPPQSVVEIE
jgi:integrase